MIPKTPTDIVHVEIYDALDTVLIDRRINRAGLRFGTIQSLAQNLGITIQSIPNSTNHILTARKRFMNMYVEKLHFSGRKFKELL